MNLVRGFGTSSVSSSKLAVMSSGLSGYGRSKSGGGIPLELSFVLCVDIAVLSSRTRSKAQITRSDPRKSHRRGAIMKVLFFD